MISKQINALCKSPEHIENYEKAVNDSTNVWICHHRLETHNSDGERRLVDITSAELKALDMYFNRPPEELIFMTSSEHWELHSPYGKHRSEETKRKMSDTQKQMHWYNNGIIATRARTCPDGFIPGQLNKYENM